MEKARFFCALFGTTLGSTPRMGHQHHSPGQSETRRPGLPGKHGSVALKGQYVQFISPFQGNGVWCSGTQGGAALCPGLNCESPLG